MAHIFKAVWKKDVIAMETGKKHDWFYIVLGLIFLVFAFVFFFSPEKLLILIALFAGIFYLISGMFTIIKYMRFRNAAFVSGWTLVYGILATALGFMFLIHPLALSALIPWLIGLFVCTFGIFQLLAAFKIKRIGASFWGWTVFSALVQIFVGLCFFLFPTVFVYSIVIFLIMQAIDMIVMGWNTRGVKY